MTIWILYVVETKQNWRERQCLGHSLNFLMQFCPKLLQDDLVMSANTFLIWNYSYAGGIKNTGGKSSKSHYTCGSLYPIGVGILLL